MPPPQKKAITKRIEIKKPDLILSNGMKAHTEPMNAEEFKVFESLLGSKITELKGTIKIRVQRLCFDDGLVNICCVDIDTKAFTINNINLWNEGIYMLVKQRVKVTFIYGDEPPNTQDVLRVICE